MYPYVSKKIFLELFLVAASPLPVWCVVEILLNGKLIVWKIKKIDDVINIMLCVSLKGNDIRIIIHYNIFELSLL